MFHVKLDAYWDTRTRARTEGASGVSRASTEDRWDPLVSARNHWL